MAGRKTRPPFPGASQQRNRGRPGERRWKLARRFPVVDSTSRRQLRRVEPICCQQAWWVFKKGAASEWELAVRIDYDGARFELKRGICGVSMGELNENFGGVKAPVTWRVRRRAAALALWTFFLFPIRCLSLPIAPLWRSGEERWRRSLFRVWAAGASWIAGIRLTVTGTPPKPPFYLVTNHLTLVDVVVLARTTGCVFVSRADVQQVGILGPMAKAMITIFIDRAKVRDAHRVNEIINATLDKGYGVHFFAESRISQDAQVHPFKPPLLEPAVQRGIPVHYAAISYSTPPGSPRARDIIVWKDGVSLAQCILNVLSLPSFDARIHFGDAPMTAPDRKQLADMLYKATLERFTPVD